MKETRSMAARTQAAAHLERMEVYKMLELELELGRLSA
jgi:hypothetical protein